MDTEEDLTSYLCTEVAGFKEGSKRELHSALVLRVTTRPQESRLRNRIVRPILTCLKAPDGGVTLCVLSYSSTFLARPRHLLSAVQLEDTVLLITILLLFDPVLFPKYVA